MGRLRLQCNSCGATWANPEFTGLIYSHVCPDQIVSKPEVTHPETHELIEPAQFMPTPYPRNENLQRDPLKPGEFVIISEGSGVTEVE